jgi:hypothetical protein
VLTNACRSQVNPSHFPSIILLTSPSATGSLQAGPSHNCSHSLCMSSFAALGFLYLQ